MAEQNSQAQIRAVMNSSEEAQDVLTRLENEGVSCDEITILSSEPVHLHGQVTKSDRKSLIGIFAVVGGFVGALAAIALTTWSSRRVNLITGGMPIVSPWALGVIVFEMTALGAILTCLVRMLFEARLVRRNGFNDDNLALAEGRIVLLLDIKDQAQHKTAIRILGPNAA